MIGSLSATTVRALDEAKRLQARTRLAATSYTLAWQSLAALLTAGFLDMLIPWPAALRGLTLAGIALAIAYRWRRSRQATRPESVRPEQVAREIETRHPELDNALIHAVQFAPAMSEQHAETAELMRREIERAEQESARLSMQEVVEQVPMQQGRRALLAVSVFILLTALIFPRAYRFEVPRFLLFWTDSPPFTLTDFDITPTEARVRAGDGLTITVHLGGLLPHHLELVTGRAGEPAQSLPLTAIDASTHTAQLDSLTKDTWFYVAADTGRSNRGWARVDYAPNVKKLTVTTHPPAYAKRADKTTELTTEGEIQGLAGTKVDLEVEADRALGGGELRLHREALPDLILKLMPKPDAPMKANAAFVIERDGELKLTLTGESAHGGLQTPDAAHARIALLHDEIPLVSFVTPGQNVLAKPDMTVPLKIEAEDDIALQRVELHRIVNKGKEAAEAFPVPDSRREFTTTNKIDLKAIGAKPGDVIEYYATAYDNDPQGIHNAESERYWVWVVSEDDYTKALKKQRTPDKMLEQYRAVSESLRQISEAQDELAKEMADNAARTAKATDPETRAALQHQREALQARQKELQQAAQDLARQMHELAQQTAQTPVEQGLQRKLNQLAQTLQQAQQGAMQQARSAQRPAQMASAAQNAAKQLQKALQGAGAKVEKMTQAMQKLIPLNQDLARLQQLAKEQAKLAQQAQQVQDSLKGGKPDAFAQSRLKSLSEQQAQNRDALSRIEQDLQSHAQEAQDVAPDAAQTAQQLAKAIRQHNIGDMMQAAHQALGQQDAPNGAQQADNARRALESLLRQSKQGQSQANGSCNSLSLSQLGQGAGNSLSQMSQQGMGDGQGQGQGEGEGTGQGASGNDVPTPGSRPGDSPNGAGGNRQQAVALNLMTQPAGVKPRKDKKVGLKGERFNDLSADATEKTPTDAPRPLPKGTDRATSRYPTEYRRLVRDYFKAVAGGK